MVAPAPRYNCFIRAEVGIAAERTHAAAVDVEVAMAVGVVLDQEARLRRQVAGHRHGAQHLRERMRVVDQVAVVDAVGIVQRNVVGQDRVEGEQAQHRQRQEGEQAPAQAGRSTDHGVLSSCASSSM